MVTCIEISVMLLFLLTIYRPACARGKRIKENDELFMNPYIASTINDTQASFCREAINNKTQDMWQGAIACWLHIHTADQR